MRSITSISILFLALSGNMVLAESCSKKNAIVNTNPSVQDSTKTYLALGDSYTIGQNVAVDERFPAQTVAILRSQNIKIKDPQYIATTGWTTGNLLNAIATQNPVGPYDVVSLLIGVNDQYQGVDTATYRQRFTQCLDKAIQLAGNKKSHVFVVSIPDYSVTPFVPASQKARVSMEIDWFNAINTQVSQQMGISYVDITPGSREAATNPALIANDGLHPSGAEYKKWAMLLAPLMKRVL